MFMPLEDRPSFKNAVNDCLDNGKGDYIERARFKESIFSCIILTYQKYTVVGDVGNSKYRLEKEFGKRYPDQK